MVSITSLSSEDEYGNETREKNRGRGGRRRRSSLFRFVFGAQMRWNQDRRASPVSPIATKACHDTMTTAPALKEPENVTQRTISSLTSSTQFASARSLQSTGPTGFDLIPKRPLPSRKLQAILNHDTWERNPIECLGYLHTNTFESIDEAVGTTNNKRIFYVHYDEIAHAELDTSELSSILSDPLLVEALELLFVCIHVTSGEEISASIPTIGVYNGHVSHELSLFAASPQSVWTILMNACQHQVPKFVQLQHTESISEPRNVRILTDTVTELEEALGKHDGILRIQSERYEIPREGRSMSYLGVSSMVITYDCRRFTFSQVLRRLISNPSISLQRIVCQSNEEVVAARVEVTRSPNNITIARETPNDHQPMRHLSAAASYRHLQRSHLRFVPMSHLQALRINTILQTPEHMHLAMQCLSPRQVNISRKYHQRTNSLVQIPLKMAWDIVYSDHQVSATPTTVQNDEDQDEAPALYHFIGSPVERHEGRVLGP